VGGRAGVERGGGVETRAGRRGGGVRHAGERRGPRRATGAGRALGHWRLALLLFVISAAIAVGEGVVYPVLHRLERDGALRSRRKTIHGRSRIYYSATRAGSRRLADLSETWTHLAATRLRPY